MKKTQTIAIVGAGPRGLAALEALCLEMQDAQIQIKVLVFEPSAYPGAGQIWSPAQVETNLSNIHERHLANGLSGRPQIQVGSVVLPAFESYKDWAKVPENPNAEVPDVFPSRAKLGSYLHERFETLKNALQGAGLLEMHKRAMVDISIAAKSCTLKDDVGTTYKADEVVLTIGHQPTAFSEQLALWDAHAKANNLKLYKDPYPVGALETETITPETTVALRGFGLSMVDQMRALSIGFGGSFNEIEGTDRFQFTPSAKAPKELIAFSLDGLPPAPKPKNPKIDSWFEPSETEMLQFKEAINSARQNPEAHNDASFLIRALGKMTAAVYLRLGDKARPTNLSEHELAELTEKLLRRPKEIQHELILSHKLPAIDALNALLDMACGRAAISLDYCLGQCWRFALGVLYHEFTHFEFNDATMVDLVKYIEASKRYSYGPPIASVQQLIALVEAGVLNLDFVDNPTIELVPEGWELHKNKKSAVADVMVNSVIDPPQLVKVTSDLVENLVADKKVNAVSYKLGLHTLEDGRIISEAGNTHQPIALLGRLAKGSVIGVDDLIECFGKPASKWAEGVVNRLKA
ncbi:MULTISPECIES: FAD/NAD(P)-binding protein [unclassified Leeuwenhoekiella]|uniref:FAD/NAD(P)-binding protein n=1 Tax=unclassified Leeuwenhoekiella TaxID=2615029 RepID=UPI0025C71754|nr:MULTISPECIES: FAD/NAD(P)-binding protein [unclassified Leeuwenhoekiella]